MGNGVSTDQGNFPTHGIRDVRKAADRKQHDWSPLAEAPITKQPNLLTATANSYIGPKLLKVVAPVILSPLLHIFNLSFSTGVFPDRLKLAKVIPVFKKGDQSLLQSPDILIVINT